MLSPMLPGLIPIVIFALLLSVTGGAQQDAMAATA
jgi:hypothetical protein